MDIKDLKNLLSDLRFDPELRAVFNAIPYYKALGEVSKSRWRKVIRYGKPLPGGTQVTPMEYAEIGRKSGVTGIRLDSKLAKLISLHAVKKAGQDDKVLSTHEFYLRLVEF